MNLPFVTRKRHLKELDNIRGRTIVYVPCEYPKDKDGSPVPIPGKGYCYHDSRIGWVKRMEFDTYDDYIEFLKDENPEATHPTKGR